MGANAKVADEDTAKATAAAHSSAEAKPEGVSQSGACMAQLQASCSHDSKHFITKVLKIAAFIDLAGIVLLAPAYPSLVLNAPGAPVRPAEPDAFPSSNFGSAINYSIALSLFQMCTSLGGAIGNPISGIMSDKVGRKFVIITCLLGGTFSYMLMFFAGAVFKSYWLFLLGNFINGLFGGSRSAIQAFLMDLWGREYPKIQPGLYDLFMFGGAGGGILGLVILLATPVEVTGRLYIPAAVAAGCSTVCALLVYFQCPEPVRHSPPTPPTVYLFTKQQLKVHMNSRGEVGPTTAGPFVKVRWAEGKVAPSEGSYQIANEVKGCEGEQVELENGSSFQNPEKKPEGEVEIPKKLKTILWTIIIAGALDNFGDTGTTYMRGVVFTKRFPDSVGVTSQAVFIILTIVLIKLSMELIVRTSMKRKLVELKYWLLIGNLCTGFFQLMLIPCLMIPQTIYVFWFLIVFLWSCCKCFGFTSTLGAMFILPVYAPAGQKGTWMGRNSGVQSAVQVITPILLSTIENGVAPLTSEHQLGPGAIVVFALCGTISILAAVGYVFGLIIIIPRPAPMMTKAFAEGDVEKYLAMRVQDFGLLPAEERMSVNYKLRDLGKDFIHTPWGNYTDDVPNLTFMYDRGGKELASIKNQVLSILTSKEAMQREVGNMSKFYEIFRKFDKDEERANFGKWMADYLDDAGYSSWMLFPGIYKIMVMTAFPPLEELDNMIGGQKDPFTMASYEQRMLNWLEVLDMHMENHASAKQTFDTLPSNPLR